MQIRILAVVALSCIGMIALEAGVPHEATIAASVLSTTAEETKPAASPSLSPAIAHLTMTVTRSITVNSPTPSVKPSPEPTVTVTQSITANNPSTSTKPSSNPSPFKACWAVVECKKSLIDFAGAYNASGRITDPNQHNPNGHDQSRNFQDQLCRFYQYENLISEKPPQYRPMNFLMCLACFKQAGLDTNTQNSPTLDLMYKIDGFCHTNWPNLFDLLDHLLSFMLHSEAPPSIAELPVDITGQIPLLRTRFTWTSDMNRKTSAGDPPANTPVSTTSAADSPEQSTSDSTLDWLGSPLTPGAPLPTELLAQVPANWPYTAYGMLNRMGPVASFPLTHPANDTQTVAWLYHSLRWNPRPLYTPVSAQYQTKTLYQPLLESWTRSATWEVSHPTGAQPAMTSSRTPAEPTVTLSLGADARAESGSSRAREGERPKTGAHAAVVTRIATKEDEWDGLKALVSVVESMRNRLDGRR